MKKQVELTHWVGHVNTSLRHPHLLTFCHEGPWREFDNRIWGLNVQTGDVWKIRASEVEGTKVIFTSDVSGYGNVYLCDVPYFDSLPLIGDLLTERTRRKPRHFKGSG